MLTLLVLISGAFADAPVYPLATCATIPSGSAHDECVDAAIAELRLRENGGAAITTTAAPQGKNGRAGKNGLVVTVPEGPTGFCPAGGFEVRTGLDRDGNGTLQDGEVLGISHICNGKAGTKGDKGDIGLTGATGTDGVDGEDASPVRLAVTGAGGGLFIDDPHQEGTHLEALWTSGVTASASQLKPSGVSWEVSATVFVAGSASAGASGGAGLFYGSSRGRLGVRAEYLHLAPSILDNGLVPFNGDGGQVRLFVEFNPRIDGPFFLTGSVGGACLWLTDGNGALLSGVPVANAGAGWRF